MKDFLKSVLKFGIAVLDKLIPKQKNLIVFGARGGSMYYDNSRYLFEYMLKHHPEFECVWLSINKPVIATVNFIFTADKPIAFYPRKGIGLWKFLRAGYAVLSHGYADMGLYIGRSSPKKVIFLWHGLPMKNIIYASKRGVPPKKPYKIDLFPVNSRIEKYVFAYCFEIPAKKDILKVWGSPRLDKIHTQLQGNITIQKHNFLQELDITDLSVEKIILYAPTYREESITKFFPFEYDRDLLDTLLERHKAIILLREHVSDTNAELSKSYANHKRVFYWDQRDFPDLYKSLNLMDCVITDYSSLYFEALYLDMPIFFIPYDEYEYQQSWEFLYPYDYITAGFKVKDGDEFLNILAWSLSSGRSLHDFQTIKHLFHEVFDGQSCKRIVEWIKKDKGE